VALDGSKISFRLRRGYARKSIKGEKLPTQNPEDPHFFGCDIRVTALFGLALFSNKGIIFSLKK
jgi:hypothetical protein